MKFDLHVHSNNSKDGLVKPEELLIQAKKIGLNGLAITDHSKFTWSKSLEFQAQKLGMILIPAEEVRAKEGDILAYGISDEIEPNLPAKDVISRIHEQGGIAVAAHPFKSLYHTKCVGLKIAKLPFDAIEVFNSRSYNNKRAQKWAKKLNLPGIAGSDAHTLEEVGNAVTILEAKNFQEVLEKIKSSETKFQGKTIKLATAINYASKRIKKCLI